MTFVRSRGELWSQGVPLPSFTRYALDPTNKLISGWCLDWFERAGRLGYSLEGGGQRRIFAILNYVNQRLLRPLHEWLGQVLRRLPMDGTYWQTRPLD